MSDHVETALPALIFTATVPGEADAFGRILADEDSANDQGWAAWGIESRNYSSSANAALYYEAEGRTAMGGSAIAAGPAGAVGAGSNVMRNTSLGGSYQAILSTQATGGGAHLSHIGQFRVWARVQVPTTNTGMVSVSFEWDDGDFRRFTGPPVMPETTLDPEWEGSWRRVNLGLVSLTKVTGGTQRWEGRILAKSTVAGDDIDIDWLMLIPVAEGSGEVSMVPRPGTPTSFSARDEFDQTAGALTAKTLPVGGTWTGAGDADDFQVSGSGTITRSPATDDTINTGRYVTASTPTLTATVVRVDAVIPAAGGHRSGVLARYTDTSNWVQAYVETSGGNPTVPSTVVIRKRLAGTITTIGSGTLRGFTSGATISLTVMVVAGRFFVWATLPGAGLTSPLFGGHDTDLATGTLSSGKVGIYDEFTARDASAATATYDNFAAWVGVADAAVFASQSLEIRYDGVRREDSGGTLWPEPSSYIGDYLRLPPAGAEARTVRVIVTFSRSVPGQGPDSGTDDLSGKLFAIPRYL